MHSVFRITCRLIIEEACDIIFRWSVGLTLKSGCDFFDIEVLIDAFVPGSPKNTH